MTESTIQPLRVALADDEPLARKRLARTLESCGCEIVAEFEDGDSLHQWLDHHPAPDALFVDVRMPGTSGIEILADLGGRHAIVLVTACPEYAVPAFEFDALDFLVKPVSPERLTRCLNRIRERQGRGSAPIPSPPPPPTLPAAAAPGRIPVRAGDGTILLETRKITHLELEDGVVWAWAGGTRMRTNWDSLADAEAGLEGTLLVRINRTVAVRPDAVRGLRTLPNGRRLVRLGDGTEVIASRRGTHALQAQLGLE